MFKLNKIIFEQFLFEKFHKKLHNEVIFLHSKLKEIEKSLGSLLIIEDEIILKCFFFYVKENFLKNISTVEKLSTSYYFPRIIMGVSLSYYLKSLLLNFEKELKKVHNYQDFHYLMVKYQKLSELGENKTSNFIASFFIF